MPSNLLIPAWYVLHTKSRFENVVREGLARKSLEAFLPRVRVRSRRKDRRLTIEVPLFPGYVFVKSSLHPSQHLDILKTSGAVKLIGTRQGPVPVPEETIESLRIMVSTDEPLATGQRFKRGDRVMVVSGPLSGVIGYFERYRAQGRVVVNIDALGQFASVNVDEADVEKCPYVLR